MAFNRISKTSIRRIIPFLAVVGATAFDHANAQVEFTKHDIYFELNATDGDAGLHGILDGQAWADAKISGPGGTFDVIRAISNQDSPEFGMTELFFESNEPPLEERSFKELTTLFPAGTYNFSGRTTANETMTGSDVLSTQMPCPARVRVVSDSEGDIRIVWRLRPGNFQPDTGVCSRNQPVTAATIQAFFSITDPDTGATRTFSADLPASRTSIEVPDEFVAGVDFEAMEEKAEVIVVAPDGNRTAIEIDLEL